jgi:hypothetical protein
MKWQSMKLWLIVSIVTLAVGYVNTMNLYALTPTISEDCSSLSNFTKVSGGTWSVSDNRCSLINAVSAATGNGNLLIHNTSISGDFVLNVNVSAIASSNSWDDFSIIFGYKDQNNYYFASFNEGNDHNTNGIFKVTSGTVTEISDFSDLTTSGSSLHHMRVEASRTHISVSRDGRVLGTATLSEVNNSRVGVGSRNNNVNFDDLVVTTLDATPSPSPTPALSCKSVLGGSSWINNSFANQTGSFTATFDAVPSTKTSSMHIGLSNGAQSDYSGYAAIVRFNASSGSIDVRNGGSYQAASTVSYAANTTYRFRIIVNLASHTYSVYVTPQGSTERTIGSNYAFRTEQASALQLNNYGAYVNAASGTLQVCNFQILGSVPTPAPVPTPTPTPGNANIRYPAQILNLTNWKVTLPIGEEEHPTEIKQPQLNTYTNNPHFMVNSAKNGVQFRAHAGGVTTSGSNYPRSELREMTNNGTSNASWSTTSGTHTMFIRQAITNLPAVKPHVVAGQIHDGSDDVIVIRLEGKKLFIDVGGSDGPTLDSNYTLGKIFTVKFEASGGKIRIYYNGNNSPTYTMSKSTSGCYFKAGAYTQSSCKTISGESCNAYGEVVIYDLQITHN